MQGTKGVVYIQLFKCHSPRASLGLSFCPVSGREGLWLYLDCLEALLELFSCSGLMFTDSNYTNIVLKNQTLLTVYVTCLIQIHEVRMKNLIFHSWCYVELCAGQQSKHYTHAQARVRVARAEVIEHYLVGELEHLVRHGSCHTLQNNHVSFELTDFLLNHTCVYFSNLTTVVCFRTEFWRAFSILPTLPSRLSEEKATETM